MGAPQWRAAAQGREASSGPARSSPAVFVVRISIIIRILVSPACGTLPGQRPYAKVLPKHGSAALQRPERRQPDGLADARSMPLQAFGATHLSPRQPAPSPASSVPSQDPTLQSQSVRRTLTSPDHRRQHDPFTTHSPQPLLHSTPSPCAPYRSANLLAGAPQPRLQTHNFSRVLHEASPETPGYSPPLDLRHRGQSSAFRV